MQNVKARLAHVDNLKFSREELTSLVKDINNLPDEQLAELDIPLVQALYKKLDPCGQTLSVSEKDKEKQVTISCVNMESKYLERFTLTAIIGYLNRALDEYLVPDGMPIHTVYKCMDNPTLLEPNKDILDKNDPAVLAEFEFNKKAFEKRKIIKGFLEHVFQYNPNEHVASSYKADFASNREIIQTMAGRLSQEQCAGSFSKTPTLEQLEFRTKKDTVDDIHSIETKKIKQKIRNKQTGEITTRVVRRPRIPPLKEAVEEEKVMKDKFVDPTASTTMTNYIPPMETFHGIHQYVENNYDAILSATSALYAEKNSRDLAVIVYAVHDGAKEAAAFRKQEADNVITDMHTISFGRWTTLSPYKENMKNVEVLNKDTETLEAMLLQEKADKQQGKKLVSHRQAKKRKEQKIRIGSNDETFDKWKESNSIAAGKKNDSDDECPDDMVELPIWRTNVTTGEIVREKMYLASDRGTREHGEEFNPNHTITSEEIIDVVNKSLAEDAAN